MPETAQSRKADTQIAGRGRTLTIMGTEGDYVFERIRATGGFYEADVLDLLSYLPIPADHLIVDVGANIGNHTIFFAEFFDRAVVAVEPHSGNADLLEANLGFNNLRERTRVVRRPLWSEHQRLRLTQRIAGNSGTFAVDTDPDGELSALTLDEIPERGERVGLLKIDTEGSEADVLGGGRSILERDHPHICVEAHDGTAFQRVVKVLAPLGYELLDIEGRSDNYIWVHATSLGAETIDSLRQMVVVTGSRQLGKHLNLRLDHLSRRIDRSDATFENVPVAMHQATEDMRTGLEAAVFRLVNGVDESLHGTADDLIGRLSSALERHVAKTDSATRATRNEIRLLMDRLAWQTEAMTAAVDARTALEEQVAPLRDRVRWLESESRLWQQSYKSLAGSRAVRTGRLLRMLVGRRRDLIDIESRRAWVRRHAKREAGVEGMRPLTPAKARATAPAVLAPPSAIGYGNLRELHPALPTGRDIVRAGLASIPERVEGLKHVVEKLYDQVDELYVYLNRFDEAPAFLRGDSRIRVFTGDDLGDRGKFRFVDGFHGYFISVDDDIDYPGFYVDHLIDGIERYGRRAAVGWHGSIVKDGFEDYYNEASRRVFSFRFNRPEDVPVHILGTGCAAFHTDALSLSFFDFPKPNMADVFFALKGQEQSVPFVVLAHQKGWARPLELEDDRSISTESMAKSGHGAFDVRAQTNRLVRERAPWKLARQEEIVVREPLSLAIVGRTDPTRWKKGGILKSTNLTADMLRPLGVDVRLFDLETGDAWNLDGFQPQVVMIYPGDPGRPDFHQCEQIAERHASRGAAVLINLSMTMSDSRAKFVVERMTAWRQQYGDRIKMLVFADQIKEIPALSEIADSIVAIPKTIDVPHPPHATFHGTEGIFLGDIAKLVNDDLFSDGTAERWIEIIRETVPEAPLFAVKQYRPAQERDLGITVLPYLRDDFSERLSKMRLMINPLRYVTFEMVPIEVAALGVPVIYQRMEQSLSSYLGLSAIQIERAEDLRSVLPALYRDPTLWRAQSRAGQLGAQSHGHRLMATQMYVRLLALAKHSSLRQR
ncbi:FkbM family methyltransferase [Jiangella aurantiaca]|uniref:FkbM family methyltransferase n=1 Tax=Jiangella aurantiaca TaxID=2530373 RepID=A0A4R5AN12_9ACTN|nr:FkbM family methyltransferase [Jiangella aurantiaca]TDD73009.1 FkbM family methyltransferase [Jiangella aurantiaca]